MSLDAKLQKLVDANIGLLPAVGLSSHFLFVRDNFVALVERRGTDFGSIGTAGMLHITTPNETKVAPLVWRGAEPWFIAKDFAVAASASQVEALRRFQSDLAAALT